MARILIVDDDPTILKLLSSVFKAAGHDALTIEDPTKVMGFLRREPVEAMVLDIIMPKLDGWGLLKQLRIDTETRDLPVVLLSTLNDVSHKVRGIRDGASDYMVKPCEPAELVARVERLIERRYRDTADLQGQLDVYSIEELCQGFEQYSKTGFLRVSSGRFSGTCVIENGLLVSAAYDRLEGHLALEALLDIHTGVFHFQNRESIPRYTSDPAPQILSSLLMNAAWIKDELHIRKNLLPALSTGLKAAKVMHDLSDKFQGLPLEDIMQHIERRPGVTYAQLMAQLYSAPNRVRLALALLIEEGVVHVMEDHHAQDTPRNFAQFFQDLTRSGGEGHLHLYALVDAGGKKRLPSLLQSAGLALGAKEMQRLAQGTGLLQLPYGDSELFLLFETIDPRTYPHQHKQFSFTSCIMLLEDRLQRPKLYKLIADFRALLGNLSQLYVNSSSDKVRQDIHEVAPDLVLGVIPD